MCVRPQLHKYTKLTYCYCYFKLYYNYDLGSIPRLRVYCKNQRFPGLVNEGHVLQIVKIYRPYIQ